MDSLGTYALHIKVYQLTAEEVAAGSLYIDEQAEMLKRFPLATFNSRERAKLIEALIAEEGITGGWYWQACFPGWLPDSEPNGPFDSCADALADAQDGGL